jgi:hypothetical protein
MIKNDKQLAIVRAQLARAESALESLRSEVLPKNRNMFGVMSESYVDTIASLREEIDAYLNAAPKMEKSESVNVRRTLVETLRLDLIGPNNDHEFAEELLPESPTRWYLTGYLVPTDAPITQKFDETSTEEIDAAESGGTDDANEPDKAAARRSLIPSSMGLSVLVPAGTRQLAVTVEWGDYVYEGPGAEAAGDTAGRQDESKGEPNPESPPPIPVEKEAKKRPCWRRVPRQENVLLDLPAPGTKPPTVAVPNSGGLVLVTTVRMAETAGLPAGTRAVAVFLVNARTPDEEHAYRAFIFQARISVQCEQGFVARPDPRGWDEQDEWDQRVADLHYRDCFEYGVGHGVSVEVCQESDGTCRCVRTIWIPEAEVERVAPAPIEDVELRMEALGQLQDGAEARAKLSPLVEHYRSWIGKQRSAVAKLNLFPARLKTAEDMLNDAESAAARIASGIELLTNDADVLEAFRVANRAMGLAARHRDWIQTQRAKPLESLNAPTWYPFQLAFLLMTLRGIAEPDDAEREWVDLLFFPTGGGKTEAYLGLAAFTIVLRRLRNLGVRSAGMAVLMRYTLRLLTLDQLGRAAALMCALELEREKNSRLGKWPFEIGLWVGQAATPNRMGARGERDPECVTAYCKTNRFRRDSRGNPAPIPIEQCPWCGTKFTGDSFRLTPNEMRPLDLRVHCVNHECQFSGDRQLPILAVDEPIYRRIPSFLIATVDKFAALPWTGEVGTLFGKVDRYDQDGFYGPCDTGKGTAIPGGNLPPPELIIQDELHLISGPLGTIAGLYETAIDALSTRQNGDGVVRPKIVASTATIRRADRQIRALFDRRQVQVFPPPGPDRRDSFFAITEDPTQSPARLYIGIAAQGRSLKVVLLRAALALLSAGQHLWNRAGGKSARPNPADPYMTLLGYFNSLRELGGSRRIVEDEVRTRVSEYGQRRRLEPEDRIFADRHIDFEVLELTSRVSTNRVADAKRRLALTTSDDEDVDVALATNMISVGLDIIRLGLMVVLGQPKTCAEYIQATSRVGRDRTRPGLVVTLLNIHKPRDRSHYERFGAFHASFYRNVEATSVTPFSPRAMDRALAAAVVALARQGRSEMTPSQGAAQVLQSRTELEAVAQRFAERACEHDVDMSPAERAAIHATVKNLCNDLLDDWLKIARKAQQEGSGIQYQKETAAPPRRLLYDFLHPDLPNLHPGGFARIDRCGMLSPLWKSL